MQRTFQGPADWAVMVAVVHANVNNQLHVADLPYRLCSWTFDDRANGALWEDANGVVLAWAALQLPFWCIDYAIHPAAPTDTLHAILAWADQRARAIQQTPFARPMWFVNAIEGHPDQAILETFGFESQADVGDNSWSKVLFQRSITALPEKRLLPDGFEIRPLAGAREVADYVALHRAVFQSENMTIGWRERTLIHPDYQPEFDLVLVDSAQQLAGFCIGWFTAHGPDAQPTGHIEPLGIRANLRGQGLGQALLIECMNRLERAGATSLLVETDNYRDTAYQLYQGIGFQVRRNVIVSRKEYGTNTT